MKRLLHNKNMLPALVILSGLSYAVSQTVILITLAPLGASALKFQLSFTGSSLADIISIWGDAGVSVFRRHFYMDFLHPAIYSSFQFFLLCYLRLKLPEDEKSRDIPTYFLLPFAAAALDLAENFVELDIIRRGTDIPPLLALANGALSSFKWILGAISVGIIVLFAIRLVIARSRK